MPPSNLAEKQVVRKSQNPFPSLLAVYAPSVTNTGIVGGQTCETFDKLLPSTELLANSHGLNIKVLDNVLASKSPLLFALTRFASYTFLFIYFLKKNPTVTAAWGHVTFLKCFIAKETPFTRYSCRHDLHLQP